MGMDRSSSVPIYILLIKRSAPIEGMDVGREQQTFHALFQPSFRHFLTSPMWFPFVSLRHLSVHDLLYHNSNAWDFGALQYNRAVKKKVISWGNWRLRLVFRNSQVNNIFYEKKWPLFVSTILTPLDNKALLRFTPESVFKNILKF